MPSPPRNHRRTCDSSRAIEQHKASVLRAQPADADRPQRPPKPVRLATPSSGYPFPLMVTTPKDEVVPTLEPYRDARRPEAPQRRATPQGDGWDTPSSQASLSRASSAASRRSADAPQRLAPLPALTSAFSDCSSSASSSSCSTPLDSAASGMSSPFALDEAGDLTARSPLAAPTTPAEVAHSRTKHAGSTPGAPPPAPLMCPHPPVAQQVFDLQDVRSNASSSPSSSSASTPASSPDPSAATGTMRKDRNPLVQGLSGLSMSSHSKREQAPGVGSKWEVD